MATYGYDDTNQLTSTTYDYQTDESQSYDANGKLTNTGYTTDVNNRTPSDGTYNYDQEGNRTRRTTGEKGCQEPFLYLTRHPPLISVFPYRHSTEITAKYH